MTEPKMLDFAVVGAQKSATTWLFECLNEHPEVFVPQKKELHFFCQADDCRFSTKARGIDWYWSNYKASGKARVIGELTTDYMYYDYVVQDLYKFQPNLKIIALLRNPVDRAYSAYWMWRRHNNRLPEFKDMIRSPGNSLLARGLYDRQLIPYMETFGHDNVKIYIYEELQLNPTGFFKDLYSWLGVDATFEPKAIKKRVGESRKYPGMLGTIIYKGVSPIINLKYVTPAWRFVIRRTNIKEFILGSILGEDSSGYPPLDAAVRGDLLEFFSEENKALFQLIGREIPAWTR